MELWLGSHVREHGARVGRLAGFELEPADRRIRRIIFSPDGELGPQAMTRPLPAVAHVHDNGEIEIRADIDMAPLPAVADVILLSRSTRFRRDGRETGRLVGIEADAVARTLLAVIGRAHWWSRRFSVAADSADCSTPGQITLRTSHGTQAA